MREQVPSKRERRVGGAERDRTDDLLNAIQELSQLSYSLTRDREGPSAAHRRAAADVMQPAAERLLSRARGDVKTAIVMGRTRASYSDARRRLTRAGGDLRAALGRGGRRAER